MRPSVDTPLAELIAAAAQVRDEAHGRRVTFSPKVFIPLTRLCRDRCGYCTFAPAPARVDAAYLSPDAALAARRGPRAAPPRPARVRPPPPPPRRRPSRRPRRRRRRLPRGAVHAGRAAGAALPG